MDCFRTKDRYYLGQSQVPFGYIADLIRAQLGYGYTELWCGKDNLPGGWVETFEGSNKWTGCEITTNFPGDDAASYQSNEYVKAEMSTLPALKNSGEVWRGNELGFSARGLEDGVILILLFLPLLLLSL